jgi:hypothetical protein
MGGLLKLRPIKVAIMGGLLKLRPIKVARGLPIKVARGLGSVGEASLDIRED